MPLPPAPAKRAALLNTEGLDAEPAKSRHTRKSAPRSESRAAQDRPAIKVQPDAEVIAFASSGSMPAYKGERKAAAPARATAPAPRSAFGTG